ncbi:hypothetical protein VTL71DRAFT_13052 [Oculimacula yallundae]|uniref:Peptidase S8/S53 domain-containing protein n=1 Tax=Oculimacula yallundae TaxID=86028 RepID=A0ABR4CPV8_9HELO
MQTQCSATGSTTTTATSAIASATPTQYYVAANQKSNNSIHVAFYEKFKETQIDVYKKEPAVAYIITLKSVSTTSAPETISTMSSVAPNTISSATLSTSSAPPIPPKGLDEISCEADSTVLDLSPVTAANHICKTCVRSWTWTEKGQPPGDAQTSGSAVVSTSSTDGIGKRRGRSRPSNAGWSSKTMKAPTASSALASPGSSPEGVFQSYSLTQKHKTPAIGGGPRRAVEPLRKPSAKDVTKQVTVYSNKENRWTDVTVTFIDDLIEPWISKKMFEMLDLDAMPGSPESRRRFLVTEIFGVSTPKKILGDPEWGFLSKRSVQLGGTTKLAKQSNNESFLGQEPIPDLPASLNPGSPAPIESFGIPVSERSLQIDTATKKENDDQVPCVEPIGSFDGIPEIISDTSDEACRADEWTNFLKTKIHDRFEKHPEVVHDPVKIAVLDTGLDQAENSIKGAVRQKRVKVVKSFVPGDPSTSDEFGHGTHVASLLLKVAPYAQVFCVKNSAKRRNPFDNEWKAINYAADELRVDIITMSFGLDKENADVQAAIRKAVFKSVIMFAAASNSGGNSEVKYPAKKDEVICVFATDGSGNPTEVFLAEETPGFSSEIIRVIGTETVRNFVRNTYCGRNRGMYHRFAVVEDLPEELLAVLKTRQGMQKIFSKLMVDENLRSGFHYIYPWKMFANDRDNKSALTLMADALRN